MAQVLGGSKRHREPLGHAHAKNVFDVVGNARRVARAPALIDLVAVFLVPVLQAEARRIEAGLLPDLAHRGLDQRLSCILAASNGLPESGPVRTLEQ